MEGLIVWLQRRHGCQTLDSASIAPFGVDLTFKGTCASDADPAMRKSASSNSATYVDPAVSLPATTML